MNVLLVDDEPLELEQLALFIKPLRPRWNLYTAVDGNQASAMCKQILFQLAFLDIQLPGKSGLEVARELKIRNESADIVIVTAFQDFQYAKESIKLRAADYLIKPIIENELTEVILRLQKHESIEYSPIVLATMNILQERFGERLNLTDIAHEIHVNPSYLSRRFSEEVKLGFSEYVIDYRIEKAKTFLVTHMDWTISQVSEITGFNSQHYFSTMFHKKTGFTPREYREMGKSS